MALSKTVLSSLLHSKLVALLGGATDDAELVKFCDAVADAVVTHVQAAAVVTGTVTTGAGAGGTVTGTVG